MNINSKEKRREEINDWARQSLSLPYGSTLSSVPLVKKHKRKWRKKRLGIMKHFHGKDKKGDETTTTTTTTSLMWPKHLFCLLRQILPSMAPVMPPVKDTDAPFMISPHVISAVGVAPNTTAPVVVSTLDAISPTRAPVVAATAKKKDEKKSMIDLDRV